ncbi:MAG: hypothetical protein EOP39_04280 [Rubrivivax sp.]|nr:MAG: hypothetical protein EOP39_04280 [Rubrivivax sp.]
MGAFATLTKVGAGIGVLLMLASFGVQGAPQEAALAAMALAFTVIPYAVFRVQQLTAETARREKHETLVLKALDRIEEAAAKHAAV